VATSLVVGENSGVSCESEAVAVAFELIGVEFGVRWPEILTGSDLCWVGGVDDSGVVATESTKSNVI
jgi:hypothetical protein